MNKNNCLNCTNCIPCGDNDKICISDCNYPKLIVVGGTQTEDFMVCGGINLKQREE